MKTKKFMDEMIDLTGETPVGIGSTRLVYRFPESWGPQFKDKCIKIESLEKLAELRKNHHSYFKRIRGIKRLCDKPFELAFYRWAERVNPAIYNHIPHFYGMAQTTQGEGMVVDYIEGISIGSFIGKNGITPPLIDALRNMFSIFIANSVEFRDIHKLDNWLVTQTADGNPQIVLVDGLGNATLIPITMWFSSLGRRTSIRHARRMIDALGRRYASMENADLLDFDAMMSGAGNTEATLNHE
ncbi:MAG: PhoP regulatory network YrbL family protein [Synergistaceae bacterium]|jgi:hypothetical protein|nr:PhoP regulatory network YrbL family protein [Synergistaceae bacterium]